jgi:phage tail sheath protein FI
MPSAAATTANTVTDDHYIGQDDPEPENRTGLHRLRNEDEISLVAIPGQTNPAIQQALIDHCELMRYRFSVLDGERPPNDSLMDVQAQRQQFDTKYAALYHPWLLIPDPFPVNLNQIRLPHSSLRACCGSTSTDIERGCGPGQRSGAGHPGIARIRIKKSTIF